MKTGIAKGITKGEALFLPRLLARRFGVLPNDVLEKIASASTGQIEAWGDRVLDAATLEDVFRQLDRAPAKTILLFQPVPAHNQV